MYKVPYALSLKIILVLLTVLSINFMAEPAGASIPFISSIEDQEIDEDSSTGPIAFTIGDDDVPAENLTLTKSSSDIKIVPYDNIKFGGSGANRTVTITPAADKNGTVTITVGVNNGNRITRKSFKLVVNAINDPPINSVLPHVMGVAHVEQLLTADYGVWNDVQDMKPGKISIGYHWQVADDENGTNLYDVGRNSTYRITPEDNGKYIRVKFEITNTGEGLPEQIVITYATDWIFIDNNPPEITEGESIDVTLEDAAPQTFTLHATDPDGDPITWYISKAASHGMATIKGNGTGISQDISYVPEANYRGNDSFQICVSDGLGGEDSVTVNVTIEELSAPPVPSANSPPTLDEIADITIDEDSGERVVILTGISSGAIDENQLLTVTAVSDDPDLITSPVVDYTSPNKEGSLRFTPVANANGTAQITVTVDDGEKSNNTITRDFTVKVRPVNDMPTFTKGPDLIVNEATRIQTGEGWAKDLNTGAENEFEQQLEFIVKTDKNELFEVVPTISPNGSLSLIAKDGVQGVAIVDVYLKDNGSTTNGGIDSSPVQSFKITIDTLAPTAIVEYSTREWTNKDVTALLVPSEVVTVTNNRSLSRTLTENGSFTFEFQDAVGNTGVATAKVDNIDKTPPVITLIGENPLTIEVFGTYKELGAVVGDDRDELVQSRLQIDSSDVDTKIVGAYTVDYNAEDHAGNRAREVVRLVQVVDTTPPEITLIGESKISLEEGAQYIELGANATDNYDGNISDQIIISSDLNTQVPGIYTICYNVVDASGNRAGEIIREVTIFQKTNHTRPRPKAKQIAEEVTVAEPTLRGENSKVVLSSQGYSELLDENSNSMFEIKAGNSSFTVPLGEVDLTGIATELGITQEDLQVAISIEKVTDDRALKEAVAAEEQEVRVMAPLIEFKVEVVAANGMAKQITDFQSYVERTFVLEQPLDFEAAVGVFFNPEINELLPVPTLFEMTDGKTIATLKHQGNGIYTIISGSQKLKDIDGHWAHGDIAQLASKLIVKGHDGSFAPDNEVTRAEFASMLVRSMGLTALPEKLVSKDVQEGWYTEAVSAAAKAGIMQGYPDGTFRPNAKVTRIEAVAMVTNALKYARVESDRNFSASLEKFGDNKEIADWAKIYVDTVAGLEIIKGDEKGNFIPMKATTRAEAAVMLKRMLQTVEFMN